LEFLFFKHAGRRANRGGLNVKWMLHPNDQRTEHRLPGCTSSARGHSASFNLTKIWPSFKKYIVSSCSPQSDDSQIFCVWNGRIKAVVRQVIEVIKGKKKSSQQAMVAPFDQVAQAETDKQEESGLSVLNPQEPV
jgi:hypothetical protein